MCPGRWLAAWAIIALVLSVAGCSDNDGGQLTAEEFFVALDVLDDEFETASEEQDANLAQSIETAASAEERIAAFVDHTEDGVVTLEGFTNGLAELDAPAELAEFQDRAVSAGVAAIDSLNDITTALRDVSTDDELQAVLAEALAQEVFERFITMCFEAQELADNAGVDVAYHCDAEPAAAAAAAAVAAAAAAADTPADVPSVYYREGDMAGVRVWQLPDAPGGDKPDQSWLAVGSDPDGNIYISGHDHTRNSMLYRLDPETGYLTWVGDARTASTAADNWEPGETAEKFHTRPTYYDGQMYVATLDRSSIDDAFMSTRGFHWYSYDVASGDFVDLSAGEPGGVGAEHLQVVTIQADTVNDRIYGMTIPDNQLLYYDVSQGLTTVVGAPDEWRGYFYSNRFMWTDSRGSVYVTGGTERSQWNQGEDRSVLDSVWRYTPDSGFEDTGFALQTLGAIEVGQWNSAHDTLYVSDDMGHIYRFTDGTATWEYLGRPDFPAGETPSGFNKVWVFQLDPGEQTIYLGRSDNFGRANEIWEFDIDTGRSSVLVALPDLDRLAGREAFITGYDSWDSEGTFYISAFSMYDSENAYLIGLNPEQIRAWDAPQTEPASPEMLALAAEVEDLLDYVAGEDYRDPRSLFAADFVFVGPAGEEVQVDDPVPAAFGLDESWDWDGDGTVTFVDYLNARSEWDIVIATERTATCEPDRLEIVCRGEDQNVFGVAAGLAPTFNQVRLTLVDGMVVRYVLEIEGQTDRESWLEQFAMYERWVADVHPDVHPIVFRSPCCAGSPEGMWFTAESFEAQRSLVPGWAESVGVTYEPSSS